VRSRTVCCREISTPEACAPKKFDRKLRIERFGVDAYDRVIKLEDMK